MNFELPQFEKFSWLLKIKLAISVIWDVIGLVLFVGFIGVMGYVGYTSYQEVNDPPKATSKK